jgi:hypothetical protein
MQLDLQQKVMQLKEQTAIPQSVYSGSRSNLWIAEHRPDKIYALLMCLSDCSRKARLYLKKVTCTSRRKWAKSICNFRGNLRAKSVSARSDLFIVPLKDPLAQLRRLQRRCHPTYGLPGKREVLSFLQCHNCCASHTQSFFSLIPVFIIIHLWLYAVQSTASGRRQCLRIEILADRLSRKLRLLLKRRIAPEGTS